MPKVSTMHSIRFKIILITVAAILVSILCVFLASMSTIQDEIDRSSVETMNLLNQDICNSIESYTEGIEASVDTLAGLAADSLDGVMLTRFGALGNAAKTSADSKDAGESLDEYLNQQSNKLQAVAATMARRTHGVLSYYFCMNPEISAPEHGFFYSRAGKTGFVERDPLDARELDPSDVEHDAWYFTSIERGRPSWVGPYASSFHDDSQVCSYVVPVYKAGMLMGVMGMDILVDTLVEQVESIQVYDTGFACLLDADGRVLYHPEMEYGAEFYLPDEAPLLTQENSGDSLIRYTRSNQYRQMSFTTLSNGMKIAAIAPVDEVNASSRRLATIIFVVAVLVVVLSALVVLLAMRYLTSPLLRLTAASKRLAAGDYDAELDYSGHDEVGELTDAFRKMRDQIKEKVEDLNRKTLTDDLTGLPKERYFFKLAEEGRGRLVKRGQNAVMLYFNLVGMKHFNRLYGYDEGDKLLCEMAQVLKRHFGERAPGRFGQDHFALGTHDENLEERLEALFEECRTINGGKTLPVHVGIYQDSLEVVSVNDSCDRAKYACDQLRGSHVGGICYFDMSMMRHIEASIYITEHLDQALDKGWIQVYYQPIVRAVNGKVCDEEALARWIDPVRGFLPPADFVPALENAGLVYKLDLYVLDQVLARMNRQKEDGLDVVPLSVNLSRSDFDACDIVEEIRRRVDVAGVNRDMITIEITESIIGRDLDFMKEQVVRFRELGFPVWMDDFGSGYSSLDVLQSVPFDLIKFDMSFMRKLDEGENGKIILTEMMQMAAAIGVDTICEGVETEEQVRFLREIGCSKLQGYHFCKPIPYSEVLARNAEGRQIGFENPDEVAYYEAIGRMSLSDLSSVASEDDAAGAGAASAARPGGATHEDEDSLKNAFDVIPMGIIQLDSESAEFVRTNQAYRDFLNRYFSPYLSECAAGFEVDSDDFKKSAFMGFVRECCEQGTPAFFGETMPDGMVTHSFVRRIAVNPVNGKVAAAIAVLSLAKPDEGATYASIARALAVDYYNIYYVDLDTEHFIEYTSPIGSENLAKERHGDDFFEESRRAVMTRMHEDDREPFLAVFTKENVVRELDECGVFTASYRLIDNGEPMLVAMRVTRTEPDKHHIIIGVSIQ